MNLLRSFPKVIRIEPASSCNLSCSHCPTGTFRMARGLMDDSLFHIVCQEIASNLNSVEVVVLYHGGEPLLNSKLPTWIKQLKALGIPFVKTVSNGMLLDEHKIEAIAESGLDLIEFSIDGKSAEENDLIRRGAVFAKIVENIQNLIDYKMRNGLELPQIEISNAQFGTLSAPEFLEKAFDKRSVSHISKIKSGLAYAWPQMNLDTENYELSINASSTAGTYCDHVYNAMTVRWNGDVVACCYDLTSVTVLGNLKAQSLSEIWSGPLYQALRRSIETGNLNRMCSNCSEIHSDGFLLTRRKEAITDAGYTTSRV